MKTLIIGLGTGRCGTVSLCEMLNQVPSSFFVHEGFMLPWYGKESEAISKLKYFLKSTNKRYVGDIGFYWLPYVEAVIDSFPHTKFICLKRDKNQTIKSYLRRTEGKNHWVVHDGKRWKKDYIWDRCFPKYEIATKEEALALYWDEYYNRAHFLEKKFPENFKVYDISVLNSPEKFIQLLNFIGVEKYEIRPIKANASCSINNSLINRIKTRWFKERKILPWRIENKIAKANRGGILNTLILAPLRRVLFFKPKLRKLKGYDISVVVPIRNVEPLRLYHALGSIYNQNYNYGIVKCIVVDYGSSENYRDEYLKITNSWGYKYLFVNNKDVWSKSRALNIGIKNSNSTFIVSTDVDVVFSPNFFQSSIDILRQDPFSVIYSYCLELPEDINNELKKIYHERGLLDVLKYRKYAEQREVSYEIHITYKFYHDLIGGYDENFKGWGAENDLYKRFFFLGLNPKIVFGEDKFYCHIWHEKWDEVLTEEKMDLMKRNKAYDSKIKTIKRNNGNWGLV